MESNLRDNRGQQPSFKRQNTSGQNVARAYTAGKTIDRMGYAGGQYPTAISEGLMHHEGVVYYEVWKITVKPGQETRSENSRLDGNRSYGESLSYWCGGRNKPPIPTLSQDYLGRPVRHRSSARRLVSFDVSHHWYGLVAK
ncbi:hypothetical protein Tco_0381578 [Tanacetum coccineum]